MRTILGNASYTDKPVGSMDIRNCRSCEGVSFHDAVARQVRFVNTTELQWVTVWQCEHHPLPHSGLIFRERVYT